MPYHKSKKNRKGGVIGIRKDPDHKLKRTYKDQSKKRDNGLKVGNKTNINPEKNSQSIDKKATTKSSKLGSKKPIQLIDINSKPQTQHKEIKPKLSYKEELITLENDNYLTELLEKEENNLELTTKEQDYLDKKYARYQFLLETLNITDDNLDSEIVTDELDLLNIKGDDLTKEWKL